MEKDRKMKIRKSKTSLENKNTQIGESSYEGGGGQGILNFYN